MIDDSWRGWVKTNLEQKSDKLELFTILLNHGYDFALVKDLLEYEPTDKRIMARLAYQERMLVKEMTPVIEQPFKRLADNHKVFRLDTSLADIFEIHDFLNAQECQEIIKVMETNLKASTVTDPNADKSVRTSSTSHLLCTDPVIEKIERKIHGFMGIGLEYGEELQGQRYEIGQEFKQHTDYFDSNATYNLMHMDRGQRTWTFMVYLDDCEEGGQTRFTRLNFDIKPEAGKVLVWNNQKPDGQGNHFTEHWGMPVIKGQKNIITKWMREKPAIRQIN
jgi:prolyl 4-hydroxylase